MASGNTVHRLELRPRFAELDPYDHINHAVYVAWFEDGRVRAMESIGTGLAAMKDLGFQMVVTHVELRYRRAVSATDLVVVESGIDPPGRASVVWRQRVLVGDDVCVEASVKAGITDAEGRPTRPPAGFLDQLAPLVIERV